MKKYSLSTAIVFLCGFVLPICLFAQSGKDSVRQQLTADLVSSRQYIFIAQSVTPLAGRMRQLTTQYDLRVSKEKLIADLPYFGTAYSAPVNPAENGIRFSSADFEYTLAKRKKDGWNISIKPKDVTDSPRLTLTIYGNGKADLQVISNNRQSISFNGYITAPDNRK